MLQYSVCVDALFDEKDLYESLDTLCRLGFGAFEFWSWADKDIDRLVAYIAEHGMTVTSFCTRKVSLANPANRNEYLRGLSDTLVAARKLGVSRLITQVGDELPGVSREKQHESIVEGLKCCVPMLEATGVMLLVEPLNTRVDHIGYYLSSSDEAFKIVSEVGSPFIKVLFDIYHQQVTEGDILARIEANLGVIGHFHAAGVPGRAELDRGELDYAYIFERIAAVGWDGFIGLEYFPIDAVEKGLASLPVLK